MAVVVLALSIPVANDFGDRAGGAGAAPMSVAPVGVPAGVGAAPCDPAEIDLGDGTGSGDAINPFDRAQVHVWVTFTGPRGTRLTVDAFWDRDFRSELTAGREQVIPTGEPRWRARASLGAGRWTWTARFGGPGGERVGPSGVLDCGASDGRGVLRVAPQHRTRLSWEDGTPFVALGENLGWYGAGGTFDMDLWMDQLAAHHGTWIRVWMPSWAFGIEWLTRASDGSVAASSLGNYSDRLDRAWQLDQVIEGARRRGLVVQLVLLNHGAFSTTFNSEWDDNPYNVSNGGPIGSPADFFSDPTARELFRRRLAYIVARWGWAPNLIWEFWNEVDLTGAEPGPVVDWHRAMIDELRALDPYDHLITTSVADATDFLRDEPRWRGLWDLDGIDLVQVHLYGNGPALPLDFVGLLPAFRERIEVFGKPWSLAEAGIDSRGPSADPELDARGMHELALLGWFLGGVGSGMPWWWDSVVHPNDLYSIQIDALVSLLDEPRLAVNELRPGAADAAAPGRELWALALTSREGAQAWIGNPDNWWFEPDPSSIEGGVLRLPGLAAGLWEVTWVDARTGALEGGGFHRVGAEGLLVDLPVFRGDLLVRLVRTGAAPSDGGPAPAPTPGGEGVEAGPAVPRRLVPRFTG